MRGSIAGVQELEFSGGIKELLNICLAWRCGRASLVSQQDHLAAAPGYQSADDQGLRVVAVCMGWTPLEQLDALGAP
eukprot:891680-Amphidinium_carterae.3